MKPLIFLLLSLFLLQSCNKCEQGKVADLTFTQDEKKINPYSGNEQIVFTDAAGDTVTFTYGSRAIEHRRIYEHYSDEECRGNYFEADHDEMRRSNSWYQSSMFIHLDFLYTMSIPTNDKIIELEFGYSKDPLYWFDGSFKFEADTLIAYNDDYRKDSIIAFYPKWKPQAFEFSKVYELYCDNPDTRNTHWISTAFYGMQDGLVGFKTTDGKVFYLVGSPQSAVHSRQSAVHSRQSESES